MVVTCVLALIGALCGLRSDGYASQYGPNIMPYTVQAQKEWGRLPSDTWAYDGFLAVANCDLIGHTALVSINDGPWELHMIADCAGSTGTVEWMTSNNILVELDYETAERYGVVGQGNVRVSVIILPHKDIHLLVHSKEWRMEQMRR